MRLLEIDRDWNPHLSSTPFPKYTLIERFGKDIPPYAILSHTWGGDDDEVTFKDILKGKGRDKTGYQKPLFCAKQAREDGLRYMWVDTCCIDKRSSAELSEAINSMYRWYQDSTKCYVYLEDVTLLHTSRKICRSKLAEVIWDRLISQARWFSRGWTLQELLAPNKVVFFSTKDYLGDKEELVDFLHEVTGISVAALLHQKPLSDFSVEERLSWAAGRKTKREEDMAYSLLGLFDIHMPLLYGEGYEKAFYRLKKEIDESLTQKKPPTQPVQRNDISSPPSLSSYDKAFYQLKLKKAIDESLTLKKPPTQPVQRNDIPPPPPLPPPKKPPTQPVQYDIPPPPPLPPPRPGYDNLLLVKKEIDESLTRENPPTQPVPRYDLPPPPPLLRLPPAPYHV